MTRRIPASELFDAEFLESLKTLRVVAGRVPQGGRFAEQRSKDLGHGIEFRDYRPYAAGDDLRNIDWNIYRRLGRVFLRLFEELEDLPLYLMPDVSESMYLEEPPRAKAGLRCALALAAISLNQHDTVGLFPFSGTLDVHLRPSSGKRRILQFADHLASIEPGKDTNLVASLRRLAGMKLRSGLVAVVSDFFDPAGIDEVVKALRLTRHKLMLVQLVRPSDRNPDLTGDLRLVDCETGDAQEVSITPAITARYQAVYDTFCGKLTTFARQRNAGLLQLNVEERVVPQLAHLFESGAYTV